MKRLPSLKLARKTEREREREREREKETVSQTQVLSLDTSCILWPFLGRAATKVRRRGRSEMVGRLARVIAGLLFARLSGGE